MAEPALDCAMARVGDILAAIIKLAIDISDSSDVKTSWELVEGIQAMAERGKQLLDEGMEAPPAKPQEEAAATAPDSHSPARRLQDDDEPLGDLLQARYELTAASDVLETTVENHMQETARDARSMVRAAMATVALAASRITKVSDAMLREQERGAA